MPDLPLGQPGTLPADPENPRPMLGAATGSRHDAKPSDDLYVPVTNLNYIPEGAPTPEGFVPHTPGNDPSLVRIAEALESQGLVCGPDIPPDPNAATDLKVSDVVPDAPSSPEQNDPKPSGDDPKAREKADQKSAK